MRVLQTNGKRPDIGYFTADVGFGTRIQRDGKFNPHFLSCRSRGDDRQFASRPRAVNHDTRF